MFTYQLTDNDVNDKNYELIIMENSSIIINYGFKKENLKLDKGNKIRWQTNVIITIDNINHYKSKVIGDVLKIQSSSKNHQISEYIEPIDTKLAAGSGWEA